MDSRVPTHYIACECALPVSTLFVRSHQRRACLRPFRWRTQRACGPRPAVAQAMSRIAIVVASHLTVRAFLAGHIRALAEIHAVTIVLNRPTQELIDAFAPEIRWIHVPIHREVSPLRDIFALIGLVRAFTTGRFDLVLSLTPKAGLLTAIAARLSAVPVRLHFFTGQVWATRRGLARTALKLADRVIAGLSTKTLADSPSQRRFLLSENVAQPDRIDVLGDGSVSGVDLERFRPDPGRRHAIRRQLGAGADDIVYLYLGRLTPDKGVLELARAFSILGSGPRALWLVGPDENAMQSCISSIPDAGRVTFSGYTERPEDYLCAADIFCLPSYREGFGTSIIEAAACGIPAVASRIYGVTDAIEDGVTGVLISPGNVDELADGFRRLEADANLRRSMGLAARERAERMFSSTRLTHELCAYVGRLLRERIAHG